MTWPRLFYYAPAHWMGLWPTKLDGRVRVLGGVPHSCSRLWSLSTRTSNSGCEGSIPSGSTKLRIKMYDYLFYAISATYLVLAIALFFGLEIHRRAEDYEFSYITILACLGWPILFSWYIIEWLGLKLGKQRG